MIRNHYIICAIILISVFFNACRNKEICPECENETGIFVKFDWQKAKHIPEGMTVLFYNMGGELVYTFNNVPPDGELVRIESGKYRIACYNNDTEYVQWSGQNKLDSLQVQTRKSQNIIPKTDKKTSKTDDELIVTSFDYLCGDVLYEKDVHPKSNTEQYIVLTPEALLDRYTYEVNSLKNGKYISKVLASLSGLSQRLFLSHPDYQNGIVTMPFFNNELENHELSAVGSMLNLGDYNSYTNKNILTLYIWSPGGNLKASFDVSDQVRNAPDPHNVHIIINTSIVVPPPIEGDEGIDPSVDEWKDITYDVIL